MKEEKKMLVSTPSGPGEQEGAPDSLDGGGVGESLQRTEPVPWSGNSGKERPSNFDTFCIILWQLDANHRAGGHRDCYY